MTVLKIPSSVGLGTLRHLRSPCIEHSNSRMPGVLRYNKQIRRNSQITRTQVKASTRGGAGQSKKTKENAVIQLPLGLLLDKTDARSKATITTYIPIVIVVFILMYLDAAFSGDWSRIGFITKEQENFLKSFFSISVGIHGILGLTAGAISFKRGEKSCFKRGLKTFVVGIVGFAEVWYLTEDDL